MITKTRTTKNGISYWITTGDDADDILYGSGRADRYLDEINGGGGNDIIRAGDGNDSVNGDDGNDKLYGEGGSDLLNGGAGNDSLDGSGGDDTVNGGAGNDVVAGGDDNDLLIQQDWFGTDRFDGGRGTDTLDYSGAVIDAGALPDAALPNASVHVSLATGTVIKYLDGVASATDTIRNVDRFIVTAFNDTLDGNSGANMLEGRLGNDVLNGGDGNDTLNGDFGANFLNQNDTVGGDDTLNGGVGSDSLFGGAGNDRFVQDSALGGDKIDGGVGSDTVDYSQLDSAGIVANLATGKVNKFSYGYSRGVDTLRNIETLIATEFNDTLTGGTASYSLAGGGGNDHFSMLIAAGNNTLDGGSDLDTLDYGQSAPAGATLAVDLQAGIVSKYQGSQLIGVDTITNMENFIVTSGANTLIGGDKNDVLDGGAGNDVLNGAGGTDVVRGGDGNDTIVQTDISSKHDILDGGAGIDTLDYSQLADTDARIEAFLFDFRGEVFTYSSGIDVNYAYNFEVLIGTRNNDYLAGSHYRAQTLDGGAGNDVLWADSSFDSLYGGAGDDKLYQDFAAGPTTINGGSGSDTLDYHYLGNGGIAVHLETGTVDKFSGGALAGTDTFRNIENFIGTDFNDTLFGDCGDAFSFDGHAGNDSVFGSRYADTLLGGAGNDTLDGNWGDNLVSGGDGDDVSRQSSMCDDETIDGGSGVDTVDYTDLNPAFMTQYVEVDLAAGTAKQYYHPSFGITLAGTDILRNVEIVIGTWNGDLLTGGANNDDLRGGSGADTLNGAGGNDKLSGGDDDDLIIQEDWLGNDRIDGGLGDDTLVYRISANLGSIEIEWEYRLVNKYSADHVLLGVDSFVNVQTIFFVPLAALATPAISADTILHAAADAVADIVTVADAAVDAAEITMVGVPTPPVLASIA